MLIWGALSAAIAIACAYSDFHRTVSAKRALSVASLRSVVVWLFLATNGSLAFLAWLWLISDASSWIQNLIVLKDVAPWLKATLVGLVVPTILKAGAFYISGNGFGIEFLYNLFRGWATDHYIDCASTVADRWAQERARKHLNNVDAHRLVSSTIQRIRDGNTETPLRLEFFLTDAYHALKSVLQLAPAEWGNVQDLENKVQSALGADLEQLTVNKRQMLTVALLKASIRQTNLTFVQKALAAQFPQPPRPDLLAPLRSFFGSRVP